MIKQSAVKIVLRLPRRRWPVWLLTAAVVFGLPVSAFIYFPALLASGTLPVDSDSIGIPMFSSVFVSLLLLPVAVLITFLCTRRLPPGASLMSWRRDKPLLSFAISVFFITPAIGVLALAVDMIVEPDAPNIGVIWTPYAIICAAWCVVLRGAALADPRPLPRND